MNDARANLTLALSAIYLGAAMANYVSVKRLLRDSGGRVSGAWLRDELTGDEWPLYAKGVINATGPAVDILRQEADPTAKPIVVPSSGSHVVLPAHFSPGNASEGSMGLLDAHTSDGRVIFLLPWQGNTLAGTTEGPVSNVHQEPQASQRDVQFILDELRSYLNVNISTKDVLATWSGIRPLVRDPSKMGPLQKVVVEQAKKPEPKSNNEVVLEPQAVMAGINSAKAEFSKSKQDLVTREAIKKHPEELVNVGPAPPLEKPLQIKTESLVRSHLIEASPAGGMLTLAGGKWTTYRAMAEECIDAAEHEFNLQPAKDSKKKPRSTRNLMLIGGHGWDPAGYARLIRLFGLDADIASHLHQSYGDRAGRVCELIDQSEQQRLSPKASLHRG